MTQVYATNNAFAALKQDGSVFTWGDPKSGGNSSAVAAKLSSGVVQIVATDGTFEHGGSFAALKSDGSVVTWGDPETGGDSSAVANQLTNVVSFANPFSDDRLIMGTPLPSISLSVAPGSVAEDGSENLLYTFSRTGSTDTSLVVHFTVGGTASLERDYTGIATDGSSKRISLAPGATTATVTVDPIADSGPEADETVSLSLVAGSGYTIATSGMVTGTIREDDLPLIQLTRSAASVREDGVEDLVFTFSRTGRTTSPLTIHYTVAGTATLGSDYSGISTTRRTKTVVIPAGSAMSKITLNPSVDITIEPEETIAITLAPGRGYAIATTSSVSARISNDDVGSTSTRTLERDQSSLHLQGAKRINGVGNNLDNTIIGNGNNNKLYGLLGGDLLIGGGAKDSDVFAYTSLSESLMYGGKKSAVINHDTIQDFNSRDRILAPLSVETTRLTSTIGTTSTLTPAAIGTLLTSSTFPPHSVAAFSNSSTTGSFIAMNDARAGFQVDTDAIIFLANHRISTTNDVEFV